MMRLHTRQNFNVKSLQELIRIKTIQDLMIGVVQSLVVNEVATENTKTEKDQENAGNTYKFFALPTTNVN
jgi:hypothetical protein